MMTNPTEALKMAIEALSCISQSRGEPILRALNACKEALENYEHALDKRFLDGIVYQQMEEKVNSQQQEPVAIKNENGITLKLGWDDLQNGTKLYTHPAPSQEATTEKSSLVQEPVAWLAIKDGKVVNAYPYEPKDDDGYWKAKGFTFQALYTHPAISQKQELVAKIVKQPFQDDKADIKSVPMVQWLNGIIPPIDTLLYTHSAQPLSDDEIAELCGDKHSSNTEIRS